MIFFNAAQFSILFWKKHPALFYGCSFLLGIYASQADQLTLLIPALLLWGPLMGRNLMGLSGMALFCAACSFSSSHHWCAPLPDKGIQGLGEIKIENFRLNRSPFGSKWVYQCRLQQFYPAALPDVSIAQGIPCLINLPEQVKRPLADKIYLIDSKLVKNSLGNYRLSVSSFKPWKASSLTNSWIEKRFYWKQRATNWLTKHYKRPINGVLLAGLLTGELDAPALRQEFARFGLQHLLAISGFHFAILAVFLNGILQFIFPKRISILFLLALLSLYCLFLGFSPSVIRAFVMSSLAILAELFERKSSALNSLGVALLVVIAFDPHSATTAGFQYSFLITAALLLAFRPFDQLFENLFSKRTFSEMVNMNKRDQHGLYLLTLFRKALALTAAVNLFAFPLTLFIFNQFPWGSLAYNLFFPFLISISMGLLLAAIGFSLIPPVSNAIHAFNDAYTHRVLQMVIQMPERFDITLIIEGLPASLMIAYVSVTLWLLILYHSYSSHKKEGPAWNWTFI